MFMKVLSVKDMSCEHCVKRITESLKTLDIDFTVDLASKTVTIDGCENCVNKAKKALEESGYEAVVIA